LLFKTIGAKVSPAKYARQRETENTFCFNRFMKLIDSELVEIAKKYGNQDNARDPVVIARYMSTTSPAVWLVIDFDPETGEAVAYKAGIGDDGWDLFNLIELSQLRIPTTTTYYDQASKRETVRKSFGRVIRDTVFTPRRLSEVMPDIHKEESPRFRMQDLQDLFGSKKTEADKPQPQNA
jgi:hypothetical protein